MALKPLHGSFFVQKMAVRAEILNWSMFENQCIVLSHEQGFYITVLTPRIKEHHRKGNEIPPELEVCKDKRRQCLLDMTRTMYS